MFDGQGPATSADRPCRIWREELRRWRANRSTYWSATLGYRRVLTAWAGDPRYSCIVQTGRECFHLHLRIVNAIANEYRSEDLVSVLIHFRREIALQEVLTHYRSYRCLQARLVGSSLTKKNGIAFGRFPSAQR